MEAPLHRNPAGSGALRAWYGLIARRLVGSAILLSGTLILATHISAFASK